MSNEIDLTLEFPLQEDIIYLNHAAVSPWPVRTENAVIHFSRENVTQGSKNYPQWISVESQLREKLRQLINADSADDIALLKNTSEALSVVAFGIDWQPGDNIVSIAGEFPSNRVVWEALSTKGVELRKSNILCEDPEQAIFDQVDKHTRLITVSSVQYSTGFQVDLVRIGQFCRQHNILFCVDAIQSIGAMQFDVQAIQADFVMADGHKWMLGPEGLALFYCRPELREKLTLHQFGWHMTDAFIEFDKEQWKPADTARRFECGSPNMLGIHALNASLSVLLDMGMPTVESMVLSNSQYMFEYINNHKQLALLTDATEARVSGIVTFRHRSIDNESLFSLLTDNGVMCAQRGGGIRFSPHFYTPRDKIQQALEIADTAI
jgi:selenocysteine lyase/cysteine desulfurase